MTDPRPQVNSVSASMRVIYQQITRSGNKNTGN